MSQDEAKKTYLLSLDVLHHGPLQPLHHVAVLKRSLKLLHLYLEGRGRREEGGGRREEEGRGRGRRGGGEEERGRRGRGRRQKGERRGGGGGGGEEGRRRGGGGRREEGEREEAKGREEGKGRREEGRRGGGRNKIGWKGQRIRADGMAGTRFKLFPPIVWKHNTRGNPHMLGAAGSGDEISQGGGKGGGRGERGREEGRGEEGKGREGGIPGSLVCG